MEGVEGHHCITGRPDCWNELMTGSSANSARLSEITLALLKDTGWYQVDFTKAEPLQWGKNAGCEFVFGSCRGYINKRLALGSSTEPFCTTISYEDKPLKLVCTSERDAVGFCNMMKDSSKKIPPDYQYYGPHLGGTEEKYDCCPFHEAFVYKNGRGTYCNDARNTPNGTNFLGETYGHNSLCLYEGRKGWLVTSVSNGKVIERNENNFGAGCYQLSSARGITTVNVLNKIYHCTQRGQQIDIDTIFNGLKYQGSLLCP